MSTPNSTSWPGSGVPDDVVMMLLGEPPSLAAARREFDAGQYGRALEHLTMLSATRGRDDELPAVLQLGAEASLRLRRPHEALAWAEQLLASQPESVAGSLLAAAASITIGQPDASVSFLDRIDPRVSQLTEDDEAAYHRLRCVLAARDGDDRSAWDHARQALALRADNPEAWEQVAIVAGRADVDVDEVAGLVTDATLRAVAGQLAVADPTGADRVMEALWHRWPSDRRIVAAVTLFGYRLPVERALEWSARQRACGFAEHCALLGRAALSGLAGRDRVLAAAIAVTAFGDDRGGRLLEAAVPAVDDEDLEAVLDDLAGLDATAAVESFVVAAAATPVRALLLARVLADRGADDAAVSLVAHAVSLADPTSRSWQEAVARALPGGASQRLRALLRDRGAATLGDQLTK